jgi:DNA-binding beta-propeller fold protein YncE
VYEAGWQVEVIAGDGLIGEDGVIADGSHKDGPAAAARFDRPVDLVLDSRGSVLVADSGNRVIRRIGPDGTVSTIAGNGQDGVADGRALEASFRAPTGLAVAPDGTIFVVDSAADMIRAITPDGMASTVAGVDYVTCQLAGAVKGTGTSNVPSHCAAPGTPRHRDGPAESALFDQPASVAVAADGRLVVSDSGNHCLREIDLRSRVVRHFSGTCGAPGTRDGDSESAQFAGPGDIAFGPDGYLYVVDNGTRIRRVDANGNVTTVAGSDVRGDTDGEVGEARFAGLAGIAVDPGGRLYVTDTHTQKVKVVDRGAVRTIAGKGGQGFQTGTGLSASFSLPVGLAVAPDGSIFLADYNLNRVFLLTRVQ